MNRRRVFWKSLLVEICVGFFELWPVVGLSLSGPDWEYVYLKNDSCGNIRALSHCTIS